MNIVFLTADEPLYLPAFFARVLHERAADTRAIFMAPSRYGRDTTLNMVRKYTAAFGVWNLLRLLRRLVRVKLLDRLDRFRPRGQCHSVPSVAAAYAVLCELIPDVNDPAFLERLRAMGTDLVVSVSCPQLFRPPLIELPARGCLNMHGALLPKYRGIAPSFWMMASGERQAGVTVFFVNQDIDAGDIVEVEDFDIGAEESLHEFIIRSKRIACEVLLRAIQRVQSGTVQTRPMKKEEGSYFGFPTREGYREFRRRGRRLW